MSTPSQEKSKFIQVPEPEFIEVEEDLPGDDQSSDEITIADLDVFVEIPWE